MHSEGVSCPPKGPFSVARRLGARFVALAGAHGHRRHGWTRTEIAAATFALIAAGAVAAGALLVARWRVKRSSRGREPCPRCGTFLAPRQPCPVCPPSSGEGPPEGKGATEEKAKHVGRNAAKR